MFKSLSVASLIGAKLLSLACFSHFGLMVMAPVVEAQMPCHDQSENQALELSLNFENCDTCLLALQAWSELLVSAKTNVTEFSDAVVTVSRPLAWELPVIIPRHEILYRPPPRAILAAAIPRIIASTVLIV